MALQEASVIAHSETLDTLRLQAVDAVLSAVSDEADDLLGQAYYTQLERNQIWQGYASEYSHVGRRGVSDLLGPESRLAHPSIGSVPEKLGHLILGAVGHEVSCRARIYQANLPANLMADTSLHDFDERSLMQRTANTWDQLPSDIHRYSLDMLGQITREILFANAMFRVVQERNTFVETIREQRQGATAGH